MYSNLIDLKTLFNLCDENYCIVKRSEGFPNYKKNSDLDILCSDKNSLLGSTLSFLSENKLITTKVSYLDMGHRLHIDVFKSKSTVLDIKFDLFDSIEIFKKSRVREDFTDFCLQTKMHDGKSFVPSLACEMVFRMLDYREYIRKRPDKIKHLHFVQKNKENFDEFLKIWNEYVEEDFTMEVFNGTGRKSRIEKVYSAVCKILTRERI